VTEQTCNLQLAFKRFGVKFGISFGLLSDEAKSSYTAQPDNSGRHDVFYKSGSLNQQATFVNMLLFIGVSGTAT
jgi:hypothetical protein